MQMNESSRPGVAPVLLLVLGLGGAAGCVRRVPLFGDLDETGTSCGASPCGSETSGAPATSWPVDASTGSESGEDGCDTACSSGSDAGGVPAGCNNGHVDPGEECDEGMDDEACYGCVRPRYVFVTSITLSVGTDAETGFEIEDDETGRFEGMSGADRVCNELWMRKSMNVDDGRRFKAWISDADEWPAKDWPAFGGIYICPKGAGDVVAVAQGMGNDGPLVLLRGISCAEDGDIFGEAQLGGLQHPGTKGSEDQGFVWTGTTEKGTPDPDGKNCAGWTKDFALGEKVYAAEMGKSGAAWSSERRNDCGSEARLFCFQIGTAE